MERLEEQLEDRLFTIHPDESSDQTNKIIEIAGEKAAGCLSGLKRQGDRRLEGISRIFKAG